MTRPPTHPPTPDAPALQRRAVGRRCQSSRLSALTGIKGRLALAIVLTALIPVTTAIVLARSMVQQSSERFFVPEISHHLDKSLGAYQDLARATKESMRFQAAAMTTQPTLLRTVRGNDQELIAGALRKLREQADNVVSLVVVDEEDREVATAHRGRPVDEATEHQLEVVRPLAGSELSLHVLFATPKSAFRDFDELGEFVDAYSKLQARRDSDEQTYVLAFAALLGVTIIAAIGVGILVAQSVTRRILSLAGATRRVAAGDLSVRVEARHPDEIGELGRGFNEMLSEVEASRGRIEYLSRLASWQEMARRLAHEIKNPLTPIQLAVQEVHQRLDDLSPPRKALLDTTLDIVQTEVQTLRRLVGEFSEFARLPQSSTEPADLFSFLQELKQETHVDNYLAELGELPADHQVQLRFSIPEQPAPVLLDRQMMRRVLINLLRNALQACATQSQPLVQVVAEVQDGFYVVAVDDNGSGISDADRERVFEPYMTTKDSGTGLGLAIAKKVALDHGGSIEVLGSPLGGARFCLSLPVGPASE